MPSVDEKYERGKDGLAENFSQDDEKGENLWVSILVEVQSSSQTKLPTSKSLLVLGDNETGKTTLIAKAQGVEEPRKGSGLEYMYINVKDEYGEEQTRLGAWIVDGDLYHRGLLKFALTEQSFVHTVVLLVASLARPWDIMESLQRWSEVLSLHVQRLKLAADVRRQQEESVLRQFQEYTEPEESATGAPAGPSRRGMSTGDAGENVLLPLGENTLTLNLGIPIVVVLTKSDAMSSLEKDMDYTDEHWDFIQQYVRKFCLKYGAALFYTSVKENKNCTLLHKYLTHRIYGFPFSEPACVIEKDAVFVPAGWDNEKKIGILYDSLSNMAPDDRYNDIITGPVTRKPVQRDVEVLADEEQLFLMKLQAQLTKQPLDQAPRASPLRTVVTPQKSSPASRPVNPNSAVNSPNTQSKKPDPKVNAATSDTGVLANFFNSLLSKKSADGKSTDRPNVGETSSDKSTDDPSA